MFPATTNAGGMCMGFPDVCKTPIPPAGPVPIPYPNMAMVNQAKGGSFSKKVKIANKNVCTTKTEISMSSGDEAGTAGGVVSSKFKGPALYKKGSMKVKAEGAPVVHMISMVGLNGGQNANMPAGTQIVPSQMKVLVMP